MTQEQLQIPEVVGPQFGGAVIPAEHEPQQGKSDPEPVTTAEITALQAAIESIDPAPPVKDMPPPSVDPTLTAILTWKRPHGSAGELHFVEWLHGEIKKRGGKVTVTVAGNIAVTIYGPRVKGQKKNVLPTHVFSCHTDTVHSECNGKQAIVYDPSMGHICLDKDDPSKGSCLGADDGAGIWLMLEMMKAKVPGVYLFHRGEERGGIGSTALAKAEPQWLEQFEIAIAFDRKGHDDIITHQGGVRCASDKFGLALAKQLNDRQPGEFKYSLSTNGSFTDTKVYRGLIDECVNVSVGYENAHSSDEYLDYEHLVRMRDALLTMNWNDLPVDRDPKAKDVYQYPTYPRAYNPHKPSVNGHRHTGFGGLVEMDDADDAMWAGADERFRKALDKEAGVGAALPPVPPMLPHQKAVRTRGLASMARDIQEPEILDELRNMTQDEIYEVCEDPDAAGAVVIALFAELEAAFAKARMFRDLAGVD